MQRKSPKFVGYKNYLWLTLDEEDGHILHVEYCGTERSEPPFSNDTGIIQREVVVQLVDDTLVLREVTK